MRYFITGATGFIGGRVAEQLLEAGHEVVVLARTPAKAAYLADQGAEVVQGDINDPASMRPAMQGADGVFHIAGWYKIGTRDKSGGQTINIDGTREVMQLAQELSIPKIVYTSTLAINSDTQGQLVDESYTFTGEHLSEYDRTKAVAHHEVVAPMARAGLPVVTVMPGAVYGPGDTSDLNDNIKDYLRGKLPMIPGGLTLCWAHVDDIAQGHILAMDKGTPGEDYIIAGEVKTLQEFFGLAEQITGIPAPKVVMPPPVMKASAALMSVVDKVVPVPAIYTGEGMRVIAGVTYIGDNSKARRDLGYNPRPLSEGLPPTLHHLMDELGLSR